MELDCCEQCFSDHTVQEYIGEVGSPGNCPRCGSSGVRTVSPSELTELFEPVIDLYRISSIGVDRLAEDNPWELGGRLKDLLEDDWGVFSDVLADDVANDLLDDIVNWFRRREHPKDLETLDINDAWVRKTAIFTYRSPEDYWNYFKYHMLRERRFIPDYSSSEIISPTELLPGYLEEVDITISGSSEWFRCRDEVLNDRGTLMPLPLDQMGAPPPEKASGGRANPVGIPFLYLSSNEPTAVAEKRPWRGQRLSIASFVVKHDLRIADLTASASVGSPFGISELTPIRWMLERSALLDSLVRELSTPIDPRSNELEYLPTQYLTELIRHLGFEGLLFKSAVADGSNLVLFDPEDAIAKQSWVVEVGGISHTMTQIGKSHMR